jgi:hypothetical protein
MPLLLSALVYIPRNVYSEILTSHCDFSLSLHTVPVWEELASSLRGASKTAVVAQIDMTAHAVSLPAGVSIMGYPTIYLFRKGAKGRPVEYRGARDVRSFTEFMERYRDAKV